MVVAMVVILAAAVVAVGYPIPRLMSSHSSWQSLSTPTWVFVNSGYCETCRRSKERLKRHTHKRTHANRAQRWAQRWCVYMAQPCHSRIIPHRKRRPRLGVASMCDRHARRHQKCSAGGGVRREQGGERSRGVAGVRSMQRGAGVGGCSEGQTAAGATAPSQHSAQPAE